MLHCKGVSSLYVVLQSVPCNYDDENKMRFINVASSRFLRANYQELCTEEVHAQGVIK